MNITGAYTGITWPADFIAAGIRVPSLNEFIAGEQRARERRAGVLTLDQLLGSDRKVG